MDAFGAAVNRVIESLIDSRVNGISKVAWQFCEIAPDTVVVSVFGDNSDDEAEIVVRRVHVGSRRRRSAAEGSTCEHVKVYAPTVLLTYPAQYEWICKLCLAEGVDSCGSFDLSNYDAMRAKKAEMKRDG